MDTHTHSVKFMFISVLNLKHVKNHRLLNLNPQKLCILVYLTVFKLFLIMILPVLYKIRFQLS